jgi:antirestriction protein ArdC
VSDFSVDWASLLAEAVSKPGMISTAYSRFWNYSAGNQLLALWQCMLRGLEPGPINTFLGWLELKRHVKKGEKALTLCMPVTVKRKAKAEATESADGTHPAEEVFTRFVYRPHWFVLAQTEGEGYVPTVVPDWNEAAAFESLKIARVPFTHLNGNAQGYAVERRVAVSPIAALPQKTLFHELAHVVLGHCEELTRMEDDDFTPVNIREVEAECVALICCESLGLPGSEFCRGYIQNWLGKEKISDRSVQKIFKAADHIVKSGRPQVNPANS